MLLNHVNRKYKTPAGFWSLVYISSIMTFALIGNPASIYAAEVTPDQLEFRRQAVRRIVFDKSQDIRLSGMWPAKVVGLDVMHPMVGEQVNNPRVSIEKGKLRISGERATTATRWVGGFNPFAVYDVAVSKFNGSGEVGMMFRDTGAENRITATLVVDNGKYQSIRWVVTKNGKEVETAIHIATLFFYEMRK